MTSTIERISRLPLDRSSGPESSAPAPADVGDSAAQRQKVKEISQQFESVFLEIVMKSMRDTVIKSELVDGGNAEDIYRSMLDTEYAKILAGTGNSQLSKDIERQLLDNMGLKAEIPKVPNGLTGRAVYEAQALHPGLKQETIMTGRGI
jgi:flagellar protein FlgJ